MPLPTALSFYNHLGRHNFGDHGGGCNGCGRDGGCDDNGECTEALLFTA